MAYDPDFLDDLEIEDVDLSSDGASCNEDKHEFEDGRFEGLTRSELVEEFRSRSIDYLQNSTGYDIIPDSGKVVVFDWGLPIRHAFKGLIEHDIKCGPVWSSEHLDFVGMLTVTDFIDILVDYAKKKDMKNFSSIEELTVEQWTSIKTKSSGKNIISLLYIRPEQTLFEGILLVHKYNIHRLPIVQKSPENSVLCIVNHQRLTRFLISKFWFDQESRSLLEKLTINDLTDTGIGTFEKLITAKQDTTILEVLTMLHKNRIPAVPIVDDEGNYIDCYTRSDVRFLALDRNYHKLDTLTVNEAIGDHHRHAHDCVPTCRLSENLLSVFERILTNRKHACACLGEKNKLFWGIFTLGDIFSFFIERPKVRQTVQGDDTDTRKSGELNGLKDSKTDISIGSEPNTNLDSDVNTDSESADGHLKPVIYK